MENKQNEWFAQWVNGACSNCGYKLPPEILYDPYEYGSAERIEQHDCGILYRAYEVRPYKCPNCGMEMNAVVTISE